MKVFFKKYKVYILAGSTIVLIGSFLYWGIFCLIGNIRFNANEVQKGIIDNEINFKKLAKIPQMQKAMGALDENEKKLGGILLKDEEVNFIKRMETMAEETQNKIDLKIVDEGQEDKGKTKAKNESKIKLPNNDYISLQVNLIGSYSNLINFIKKLENFEYYVNVISVNSGVEEDKTVGATSVSNPFVVSERNGQLATMTENKPNLLLKTQINFVAYIKE